jgi:mannose-1-phosphate guanylyltransferase
MKAILLAAGFGTRLRPLTDQIPKCLVTIHGKPLLGIWIDRLQKAGIAEILVNTHYLYDQVNSFIDSCEYKKSIKLSYEPIVLGTAGTLLANLDFFEGQDGMLIHADNFCMADFSAFQKAHFERPARCLMTAMTFRSDDPSACGIYVLDRDDVVVEFYEKVANPPGNLANGAIYIISKEMQGQLRTQYSQAHDFSDEIISNYMGKILSFETRDIFLDIGTPKNYEYVNNLNISVEE